ncbi:MAG: glycerol-3-phosphate acyltransferase [Chloroflexota bacterium]
MNYFYIFLAIISAYFIGSFPSAYLAGRLRRGVDIRREGSRNMGAMNVFYNVGLVEGLLVLAADIGKGAASVALAHYLGVPQIVQLSAGVVTVLGHNFPLFLNFRGGKGGATCIGILIYLMPWGIPFYAALFGIGLLLTRNPTLSYSLAFICFPFVGWLLYHKWELAIYTIVLLLFVLVRYIPRIIEMRARGGSWRHVVQRKGLQDRL